MTRALFIKNIMGALIGVAVVPKALTKTIIKENVDEVFTRKIFTDTSRFMLGDIVMIEDGSLFYLISKTGDTFIGKNVKCERPLMIELLNSKKGTSGVIRYITNRSEYTYQVDL